MNNEIKYGGGSWLCHKCKKTIQGSSLYHECNMAQNLDFCDKCNGYTFHEEGYCLDCQEKLRKEAMGPDDELIEYLHSEEYKLKITIETLTNLMKEPLIGLDTIGRYQSQDNIQVLRKALIIVSNELTKIK